MAINFPSNPNNGDIILVGSTTYTFDSASGVWDIESPAPGTSTTVYADMTALVAATGMSNGDFALVTSTNNIYVYNGSGWYKIATVQNDSPSAITGVNGTYELATDGTATVITAVSTDPEGFPLTWSYAVTSGSLGTTATVSQVDNVFTITPSTTQADAGTFELTFSATDGINGAVNASSEFSLRFSWINGTQQAKIQASDAQFEDKFGQSVSISDDGNTAIIGAWGEDTTATGAGAAYIFTRSGTTWSQEAKIQASDAEASDGFSYGWGDGVCISGNGDTAIIGAYQEDTTATSAGAAYIFTRSGTTWSQEAKIQASDAQASDLFGASVSISDDGNTVIVGARGEDTGGSNAGSAYIFTRSGTTWSQEAKIQASDAAGSDNFGWAVSISDDGNTALVGAWGEDTTATGAGAAYIFTRSGTTWSQEAKLVASDGLSGDRFGRTARISGDGNTALIASPWHNSYTGAAYIFTRSGTTWSQEARIQSDDITAGDYFGEGVSISDDGDTVVIGAWQETTGGTGAGAAYIFARSGTTWAQEKKLLSSDIAADDKFGWSVSISGDANSVLVGAHNEDTTASNAGSAYVFVK